jgi:hypothetical protein
VQVPEQLGDGRGHLRVEIAGRLVRPDDSGLSCECTRNRYTLLLAAGQLHRPPIQAMPEADARQRLTSPRPRILLTHSR